MTDPVTLAMIATSVASSAVSAGGTILQGKAGVAAAQSEANMLNAQGADQQAVATQNAAAKAKEASLLMSNAQAVSANSGGSATDGSVLDIIGGIAAEGNVQSRELTRQGEMAAQNARYQGKLGMKAARQNQKLGYLTAGGQMLSGMSDAFSKYGAGKLPPSVNPVQGYSGTPMPWYEQIFRR